MKNLATPIWAASSVDSCSKKVIDYLTMKWKPFQVFFHNDCMDRYRWKYKYVQLLLDLLPSM
jgi:hypothetical protein